MVTNFILTFAYDPMGQRISKTKQVNTTVTKSYYFRDAQGQILQVMNSTVEADGTPQYSFEYPVYGSSRLGTKYPSISTTDFQYGFSPLVSYSNQVPLAPAINRRVINIKASVLVPIFTMVNHGTNMTQYELTNHLGNLAKINRGTRLDFANPERFRFGSNPTIKDEKEFYNVSMGSGITYTRSRPIVLTATDYYPFGMPMPNRTYSLSSKGYRFGFNTQEKDDEVYGEGNLNTAQFWEYNTRLGRRWNVDPKYYAYDSRYLVNGDNPNYFIDPNGDFKSKFFANLSRSVKKLMGKEVGDVYQSEDKETGKKGEYGYAVKGEKGWKHNFGGKKAQSDKITMKNSYVEFNAGFAFGGGIGFSIGKVYDHQGNANWYSSFSGNLGLFAGAGFSKGEIMPTDPNHKFVNSDFAGDGKSYSAGYEILGVSGGGSYGGSWYKTNKYKPIDDFNPAKFGENNENSNNAGYITISGGLSKGPGFKLGGTYSHTSTWLFND